LGWYKTWSPREWTSAATPNWSFIDNLEWVKGYDLQFGLYGSDPTAPELERTPKPASIDAISAITKDIKIRYR
jgi:beta-glucosidase/6-phospho-beta-glucosidase/beta-galactosidase